MRNVERGTIFVGGSLVAYMLYIEVTPEITGLEPRGI